MKRIFYCLFTTLTIAWLNGCVWWEVMDKHNKEFCQPHMACKEQQRDELETAQAIEAAAAKAVAGVIVDAVTADKKKPSAATEPLYQCRHPDHVVSCSAVSGCQCIAPQK